MNFRPPLRLLPLWLLLFVFIAQFAGVAQAATPLRRPISPQQPMWLIHIDTWNYADPQKIIDLIPADIRPFVVMNISLSISNDGAGRFQVAEYGYEIAKSWLRACAQNKMWAMVQPSSGGYSQFSDTDLSVYEEFYRDYPNLIGFNYCEQFWGYDSTTNPLSAAWTDRINHFANLLALSNRHGGYLVVSWCGNEWTPSINPIGMLKRVPAFAAACRDYTENYILCEKHTQKSYQYDMESLCLGAYLSGYAGQYGIRYDQTGWTDADGVNPFTMATQGAPFLEHVMLTGQTVIDGPEIIWYQCFHEISAGATTDGYSMRRWQTYSQFDNVSVDLFRKVIDGTVRIPTRREVIDRTKVVATNNVSSGTGDAQYSSLATLFEGLYRMDGDGNLKDNISFFKKTGRYPTIPTVYALDDADAQSFAVKVNHSAAATRWPTISSKTSEFNGLFPQEYTGDIYAGRHENGWVIYNPFKTTGQTASGSIPFKYNTCDHMELTLAHYTAGVVKEYANSVTYYLSNYDNVIDTGLKTDTIKIYGATTEPIWSSTERGSHQASVVTKTWASGVLTLTVQHNGPLDITVNCAGTATGRLTAYTPAAIVTPVAPPTYVGPLQYEAECFDYKNINGITTGGYSGDVRNYTGQGYLRFGSVANSAMRDTVTVPAAGNYQLKTRYSFVGANISSIELYVNGTLVATPTFTGTPTLSDWAVLTQTVTLKTGANTIEYRANATRSTTVHFDNIVVVPSAFTQGTVIQENEDGFVEVGGVISTTQPGYTGTGYADAWNSFGVGIRWKINSSVETTAAFTFRYASTEDRTAALYIEGVNVIPGVFFPSTGSLSNWELVTVHALVGAGHSSVRLQSVSATGLPNIDFLGVGGAEVTAETPVALVADTYVRDGGSANTNYGTSTQLVAKTDGTPNSGFSRITYLKFNVSGLADAQSVKLKLVPFQVDGAATLSYERIADDTWTETGMMWNNRPTAAGTLAASVGGYTVSQPIEIDITEAVKTDAAGDGILSLRISNGGSNFIGFHSRESATPEFRPTLEYTFSTVTPDSTPLALYLRLDASAGTTATDSSGYDRNGSLVNASTWVTGSNAKIDGALKLTGGHVTLPTGIVSGLNDCTVAFWVKLDSVSNWARVFDFNNGTTASSMYFVPKTSGGLVRFGLSGQTLEAPADVQFTTGVWTHVAITLSGNTTTMYFNGTAVANTTTMTNNPSGLGATPNNYIGKSASTSDPALLGTIDDFRIYSTPLSASDIAAMFSPDSPTVSSLNRVNATPSNASIVNWTLTFDSPTTGVTASNFSLSGTATSGASIGTPTTTDSGLTWNIPAITGSGSGTLQLDLANATGLSQAISTSLPFSGQAYTMDKTPPAISIGAPSASPTRSGPITYSVTYSDTNFGSSTLANGNITLNSTGSASGTLNVTGSGTTRTVTISSITGDGTLGISVAAGTASDTAGNTAPSAGPSTTCTVDNTAPTVAISAPSVSLTKSGPVSYTVTYSAQNTISLVSGNITVNTTGSAAVGSVVITGSGNTRTVTLSSITGDGTAGISLAAGTASDTAGNTAPSAGPSTTFTVDNTAPTVAISAPSVSLTKSGPVSYTVTYSGQNTISLVSGNITVNTTGSAAVGSVVITGSGNTRTVTLSSITGDGTAGISLAAGTASDTAGNTAPSAGPSTTFTVDNTAPVITSGATASGVYRADSFSYTITASGSAMTYGASALPSGLGVDSGSGEITGTPTQAGTFNATITATDAAGNVDSDPLTITINAATLTVTGVTANHKPYDGGTGTSLNLGGAALSGVFGGDTVTLVTTSASGAFDTAIVGTGKTVTVSGLTLDGAQADNYTLTQPTTTADITKVQLTVTADAKSRIYGASNPTLTATITGFVNSETEAVLSGSADLSTGANATSAPGGYTITAALGTLSATNYTFAFADGTLTVTALAYSNWKAENFDLIDQGNDAISGSTADPDGDQLSNLAEYALGTDPHSFTPQPAVSRTGNEFSITFQRPAHIGDVSYFAEASDSMQSWENLVLEVLNPGNDPETVKATKTLAEPLPERQFIRLRFVR